MTPAFSSHSVAPRALGLALAALLGAFGLSGCAAITTLGSAAQVRDVYALTPLSGEGAARGSRHLVVEVPDASGAIGNELILVTPTRLQAAYLPGARWSDPAPLMMQTLLVQSLQASGAFRLVGRTSAGFLPDYTLLGEMRAFQAEPGPEGGPPLVVRVALTLTLARESDGAILATRDFSASAGAASADALTIVAAFDAATGDVLRQAVAWTASGVVAGGV